MSTSPAGPVGPAIDYGTPVAEEGRNRSPAKAIYATVSNSFAILLLIAAGLKADLAVNGELGALPANDWNLDLLAAGLEVVVGVWLLSGIMPAWGRRIAMALLSVFVVVAAWHLARGETDCGCFGRVRVHPAWTLSIDAAALLAVWYFGRRMSPSGAASVHTPGVVCSYGVRLVLALSGLAIPCSIILLAPLPRIVSNPAANPTTVVPRDWKGQLFPLLYDLAPSGHDLSKGRWAVILVNRKCQVCEEYLAHVDLESLRRAPGPDGSEAATPRGLALIDLGEHSPDGGEPVRAPVPAIHLREGRAFLADGPYVVLMTDGIVEEARRATADAGGRGACRPKKAAAVA